MTNSPTANPVPQVDESAQSAMLEIELVFARHPIIPRHMRLAILATLLGTEVVEAALASDTSPKATAVMLTTLSSAMLSRQVDGALQTHGALN